MLNALLVGDILDGFRRLFEFVRSGSLDKVVSSGAVAKLVGSESNRVTEPSVVIPLRIIMKECAQALSHAAQETDTETDPIPRNLLAALSRIDAHVHFLLRVTNPTCVGITHQVDLGELQRLRDDVAQLHEEVGHTLCCAEGFVQKPKLGASPEECATRLRQAAGIMTRLSAMLEQAMS